MKLTVKIGERAFEVEVGDLRARPVVAIVDGQRFEVWPEGLAEPAQPAPSAPPVPPAPSAQTVPPSNSHNGHRIVRAPIPGTIVSIAVQPGEVVAPGQELCVLEAMKMKNLIRSGRGGRIALIHASAGQHVEHHQALMEYAD